MRHQQWLGTFLDLSHGVPMPTPYRRVFERVVNQKPYSVVFLGWVSQVVKQAGARVVGGKVHEKGPYDPQSNQPCMVSAWAVSIGS